MKNFFIAILLVVFFEVLVIAQNTNVALQSQLSYPNQTCANICGYVDLSGNEYALVGASQGMSIVNVTNPSNPFEVIQIPGPNNLWKEIKVRGNYAYVTSEGGGGLQIVNLSSLPNASGIIYHNWTGDGTITGQLNTIHALHIDGDFVYLYGSNLFNGGAIAANLTDPWNPTFVGEYQVGAGNSAYVHDGFVRNDTLYAGHIYSGYFSVVDFTNKANPIELVNQFTPNNFTHNTWLSTNSKILFTTDEVDNSYLTAFDITNLANITELDKIQSNAGSNSMVHNTHIIKVLGNDYAVTSWYKDGFTIVDAGRPQNLIQVGNYDTFSASGGGSEGAWGVFPYLPSGTIVVSNIDEGLFVFTPSYVRACYLEGNVTSVCGEQLNNTQVAITALNINENTDIAGQYKTGTSIAGTYTVVFSKAGYISQTISGVILSPGVVNALDIQLVPVNVSFTLTGLTVDSLTATPLSNVNVSISNQVESYNFISDGSGNFSDCNILAGADYDVILGKWGYNTYCTSNQLIDLSNNTFTYPLSKGYYDDFALDLGWTINSSASTGAWERGVPLGTVYNNISANPGSDATNDCSDKAFVTGNTGVTGSDQDIDDGATTLLSPIFDLTSYASPYLEYSRWFFNDGGTGSPNDSLCIYLNNGTTTSLVEFVISTTLGNSTWVHKSFKISDFISPTSTMQLRVKAADNTPGHIVEAGFDKFSIKEGPAAITENIINNKNLIEAFPNPFAHETIISYQIKNKLFPGASISISDITGRTVYSLALTKLNESVAIHPILNAGIYFVILNNGSEISEPLKIIKYN